MGNDMKIRILPTQIVCFNFKVKNSIIKGTLFSSSHFTTPFKGMRIDSLVFSQLQDFFLICISNGVFICTLREIKMIPPLPPSFSNRSIPSF